MPAASAGVNYGTGKVRFPAPVPVGSRVRGGAELDAVEEIAGGVQTTITITIEVEGQAKPACVVESLSRWLRLALPTSVDASVRSVTRTRRTRAFSSRRASRRRGP